MSFDDLQKIIISYMTPDEINTVNRAYQFALKAHEGQKRNSGEPFISHPLRVAFTLAQTKLDSCTVAAALLHDIVEDTPVTHDQLIKEFGGEIASLVDGVSKVGRVRLKKNFPKIAPSEDEASAFYSYTRQVEMLRKMFLAMAQDIRVILIKLADRLHNMETLSAIPKDKQYRIAQETLEIFAPIAHRLGIGELKGRLEDLAFPYVYPADYARLQKMIGEEYSARTRYLHKVQGILQRELKTAGIEGEINGRAKHMYSLFKKLKRYHNNLNQIYDLVALRIIVGSVEDCYTVLGIIHKLWKPLPGRIKDYISMPKPNGYQSLHTTVFCLDGQISEIQIRTRAMHEQAEYGIAAHWHYKQKSDSPNKISTPAPHKEIKWVQQLADLHNRLDDPHEIAEGLKLDFFEDRIFVFTPAGDVHNLPSGATPIDFAFAIHSDIGTHCAGAKVNGKMVTLSYPLQNGDLVEITTSKKAVPKSDWLNYAKSSHARSLIKQYVNQ